MADKVEVDSSVLARIWIFFQKKELLKFFRELFAKERSYPSTPKVGECISNARIICPNMSQSFSK